jgi:3-oxoacyl-[acyl-carrier protein] reductase
VPLALVTGATRRAGIGAAVVAALRRDGWTVATAGSRAYDATQPWRSQPDDAEEVAAGSFFEVDLADAAAPGILLRRVGQEVGAPTAIVACHAESRPGGVLEADHGRFDRHLAVNARSVLLLLNEFARRFSGERGSGRFVALTSDAVHGEVDYGASKAALERIIVAAAAELGSLGITVNAVDPGPTDTGWISPALRQRLVRETPLGRVGQPKDAAEVVAFLCSPGGGWITGQVIRSDGGWSIRDTDADRAEP